MPDPAGAEMLAEAARTHVQQQQMKAGREAPWRPQKTRKVTHRRDFSTISQDQLW